MIADKQIEQVSKQTFVNVLVSDAMLDNLRDTWRNEWYKCHTLRFGKGKDKTFCLMSGSGMALIASDKSLTVNERGVFTPERQNLLYKMAI